MLVISVLESFFLHLCLHAFIHGRQHFLYIPTIYSDLFNQTKRVTSVNHISICHLKFGSISKGGFNLNSSLEIGFWLPVT